MSIGNYLRDAALARQQSRKSAFRMFCEAAALRFSSVRLGISEYFFYRLFDDSLSESARREFIGWRYSNAIDAAMNDPEWRAIANDKLLCYSLLDGLSLPYPRIRAFYDPRGRSFTGAKVLTSVAQVRDYLAASDQYPFFMKPVHGSFGRGAYAATKYQDGNVHLADGSARTPDTFLEEIADPRCEGYLFQEQVLPHPTLSEILGEKVSSLRAIVLATAQGPKLLRVIWKVPTGRNMSDNFMHGSTGNLLGSVDVATGRVIRVVSGVGPAMQVVNEHPDTGRSVRNLQLPNWEDVRRLCLTAGSAIPGLRFQHWDIALSKTGPLALEVNVEGSEDLPQLAGGSGLLTEDLRAALAGMTLRV